MFLQEYEDNINLIEDDLVNSSQAMCTYNSQKWIDALKDEMKSMHDNDICDLDEVPEGVKPIGCKCIFKTKKDPRESYIDKFIDRFDMKDNNLRDRSIAKADKFNLEQYIKVYLKRNEIPIIPYAFVV
ncbi:hypothetical protein Lal_00047106 [Lupinus albus]|nr:hypothetical protein Lal_00047106 [Lupinus albus]